MKPKDKGPNSSGQAGPAKRKRGRPRKIEELNQDKSPKPTPHAASAPIQPAPMPELASVPVQPVSDANRNSINAGHELVGQAVSGICDGFFGDGFLVSIRIGNSDTVLRAAAFLPGRSTAISAENDVSPHSEDQERREIPVPFLHPQIQWCGSASRQQRKRKQLNQREKVATVVPEKLVIYNQQSSFPAPLEGESASVPVGNLQKNDADSKLEGERPQEALGFGRENQFESTEALQAKNGAMDSGHELKNGHVVDEPTVEADEQMSVPMDISSEHQASPRGDFSDEALSKLTVQPNTSQSEMTSPREAHPFNQRPQAETPDPLEVYLSEIWEAEAAAERMKSGLGDPISPTKLQTNSQGLSDRW